MAMLGLLCWGATPQFVDLCHWLEVLLHGQFMTARSRVSFLFSQIYKNNPGRWAHDIYKLEDALACSIPLGPTNRWNKLKVYSYGQINKNMYFGSPAWKSY